MGTKIILAALQRWTAAVLCVFLFGSAVGVLFAGDWLSFLFLYSDSVQFEFILACFAVSALLGVVAAFQGKRWAMLISILACLAISALWLGVKYIDGV